MWLNPNMRTAASPLAVAKPMKLAIGAEVDRYPHGPLRDMKITTEEIDSILAIVATMSQESQDGSVTILLLFFSATFVYSRCCRRGSANSKWFDTTT